MRGFMLPTILILNILNTHTHTHTRTYTHTHTYIHTLLHALSVCPCLAMRTHPPQSPSLSSYQLHLGAVLPVFADTSQRVFRAVEQIHMTVSPLLRPVQAAAELRDVCTVEQEGCHFVWLDMQPKHNLC